MMKKKYRPLIFSILLILSCEQKEDKQGTGLKALDETIEVVRFPHFNLSLIDYCPSDNKQFSDFFFVKENLLPSVTGYNQDSDGDGLEDQREANYTLKLNSLDFNKTNSYELDACGNDNPKCIRDLILVLLGLRQETLSQLNCPVNPSMDDDQDGLSNCEEFLAGTNKDEWDSDQDSIPDEVELRFGLNPNFKDALLDTDADGFNNLFEVKKNAPIDSVTSFTVNSNDKAISARQQELFETISIQNKSNNCVDIKIEKIPYLKNLEENSFSFYFVTKDNDQNILMKKLKWKINTAAINSQNELICNFANSENCEFDQDESGEGE